MAVTYDDLNSFHRFAQQRVGNGGAESFQQLVFEWQAIHERAESQAALREAISQLNAGLAEPLEEALEDIRQRLNISSP